MSNAALCVRFSLYLLALTVFGARPPSRLAFACRLLFSLLFSPSRWRQRAERIVLVPCCYEKLGGPKTGQLMPLSSAAASRTRLAVTREDAYLAVADGVVTSSGKEAETREREQAWRLAFDCWRRAQQPGQEVDLLTVPSAPSRLLGSGDFAAFCRHCVSARGRNVAARRVLAPCLDAALAAPGGRAALEAYVTRGEALRRDVARLELVRRAFQRPLEVRAAAACRI